MWIKFHSISNRIPENRPLQWIGWFESPQNHWIQWFGSTCVSGKRSVFHEGNGLILPDWLYSWSFSAGAIFASITSKSGIRIPVIEHEQIRYLLSVCSAIHWKSRGDCAIIGPAFVFVFNQWSWWCVFMHQSWIVSILSNEVLTEALNLQKVSRHANKQHTNSWDSMSWILMFLFLSARWILRIRSDSGDFCFQGFLIFFAHLDICTRFTYCFDVITKGCYISIQSFRWTYKRTVLSSSFPDCWQLFAKQWSASLTLLVSVDFTSRFRKTLKMLFSRKIQMSSFFTCQFTNFSKWIRISWPILRRIGIM